MCCFGIFIIGVMIPPILFAFCVLTNCVECIKKRFANNEIISSGFK